VTDLNARSVVDLFIGFGGVVRREAVAREAEVFLEGPGLAGLLPIVATPTETITLRGTPHEAIFQRGLEALRNGSVAFRDPSRRASLLEAYREVPEQPSIPTLYPPPERGRAGEGVKDT